MITKAPVLKYFNPKRPIKLSVDASSKGLGAVLLQDNHPIAYASKAFTTCQQNYAQIEKELLAIVFGCNKFHDYVYGMPIIEVETDHKPLEAILKKPFYQAPARLQKMIMSIQKYPINLVYRPGKQLVIADTLSRAYTTEPTNSCTSFEFEVNVLTTIPISDDKLHLLQTETWSDPVLQHLMQLCTDGWPDDRSKVPTQCLPFWTFRDQISFNDGVLFKGEKIIIPKAMQPAMLKLIHSSHLGIENAKDELEMSCTGQECHHKLKTSSHLALFVPHTKDATLKNLYFRTVYQTAHGQKSVLIFSSYKRNNFLFW